MSKTSRYRADTWRTYLRAKDTKWRLRAAVHRHATKGAAPLTRVDPGALFQRRVYALPAAGGQTNGPFSEIDCPALPVHLVETAAQAPHPE